LSLIAVAIGLAGWLGFQGPAALRERALEAILAHQTIIAQQGAARIGAALDEVSARLADPRSRRSSGIEVAPDAAALRAALSRFPREGLPAGVVLFVHTANGQVLAADDEALGPWADEFRAHHHVPREGPWTQGAGVCPICLSHLHQVSVVSPLGGGRYLAANVDVSSLAKQRLASLVAGPGHAAWLTDGGGTVVFATGDSAENARGQGWRASSAHLPRPASGWQVHVATSKAVLGQGVASGATSLLLAAAGIGGILFAAGLFLLHDLRQRQREELRRAAAMAHQDKLVTLGALTAGIGHELRNVVMGVVGNIDFAREAAPSIPEVSEALDDAQEAAGRLQELACDLTMYGRCDDSAPAPRPLRAAVEEALRLTRPGLKHGPPIETDFRADPIVAQSGGQLAQVVLNLVRNAAEAMDGRPGKVSIQVSKTGATARVIVDDDGPGLPPDSSERLFEPFFTTKPAGVGTGLGLAVCAEIVRRHGGTISAENRAEGGARFRFELPCLHAQGGRS